jgi:acetyltransferase-like isoleucine patch superfamily enzyme
LPVTRAAVYLNNAAVFLRRPIAAGRSHRFRRPNRHPDRRCDGRGRRIGAEALIANHATVLDGAVIGARSLIAAGALVTGGTKIPDEVLVVGAPATIKGPIAGTGAEMWVKVNPKAYQDLAQRYLAGLEPI